MKKLSVIIGSLFLASCAHFKDGGSVWGGGLFIVPWLTGLASVACFIVAYISGKSNSTTQVGTGSSDVHVEDNTGNVGMTHTPYFFAGIFLAIITVAIIYGVNMSK